MTITAVVLKIHPSRRPLRHIRWVTTLTRVARKVLSFWLMIVVLMVRLSACCNLRRCCSGRLMQWSRIVLMGQQIAPRVLRTLQKLQPLQTGRVNIQPLSGATTLVRVGICLQYRNLSTLQSIRQFAMP